jgi:hypothetical protein
MDFLPVWGLSTKPVALQRDRGPWSDAFSQPLGRESAFFKEAADPQSESIMPLHYGQTLSTRKVSIVRLLYALRGVKDHLSGDFLRF